MSGYRLGHDLDDDPDNLTSRCRRCHHDGAHDNPRAVDDVENRLRTR